MSPERILTYRFFQLPYIVRLKGARELGIWEDEDYGMCQETKEIFDLVFEQVCSVNMVADLWDRVEEQHGDGKYPTNPFREKR